MRDTILLLVALCLSPVAVFADSEDSTGSDIKTGRPYDAKNVVISGSMSVTHFAGDGYGGEGETQMTVDALLGVFVLNHVTFGTLVSVVENVQYEWWDSWSVGPMIGFYGDPAVSQRDVRGSLLPFVRCFGQIGKTELYAGNTTYSVGGDVGMAVMASRHLSVDFAVRLSWNWIQDVGGYQPTGEPSMYPPATQDKKFKTLRFSIGLSGFIG